MNFPFNKVVFDGGVLIELLLSGDDSEMVKSIINENIIPFSTNLALIEAEYILCRKIGKDKAFEKIDDILESQYIEIISLEGFLREISTLKCNNSIALPDCASIALAIKKKIPALFAKKENELIKRLDIKPFEIKIFFLEELI